MKQLTDNIRQFLSTGLQHFQQQHSLVLKLVYPDNEMDLALSISGKTITEMINEADRIVQECQELDPPCPLQDCLVDQLLYQLVDQAYLLYVVEHKLLRVYPQSPGFYLRKNPDHTYYIDQEDNYHVLMVGAAINLKNKFETNLANDQVKSFLMYGTFNAKTNKHVRPPVLSQPDQNKWRTWPAPPLEKMSWKIHAEYYWESLETKERMSVYQAMMEPEDL